MIRRYLPSETVWEHNKFVLKPINATVTEEANGMFELEIELPKGTELNKRDIITAPTPRGEQPFRVYRIVKTLYGIRVNAKHIFYDLADSLLLDARPTNQNGHGALQTIITASGLTGWTYFSDIAKTGTAYYIRKNPVEAIMGADNCLLRVWGGNLIRNKKDVRVMASGVDRGYEIRLGKNLVGIEDDSDDSAVVTRLYPTYEKDNVIFDLPEKYIDSPLINNYISPIVREERVSLTDAEKELPLAEIHELIRTYCQNLFTHDNVDKPIINYKVDFVELSKYRSEEFLQLEKIDLYDIVTVDVAELGIKLKARVIKYTYDAVGEKYLGIELGGFKPSNKYSTDNIIKQIEIDKENASDEFRELFNFVIDRVTGNKGGYQVTRVNANGEPYETLWMDTPNMNTAKNVLRINKEGIAGSINGINGPYATAITTDGWIVAERIMAYELSAITANLGTVTSGRIQSSSGNMYWDLNTGEFVFEDGITKLDGSGAHFGKTGETIETGIAFDGVRISDGEDEIASFTGSGAVIKNLDATFINGDVINIMSSSMTFDVGTGTGYYADFSEVLNAIGNRKHLANGVKLTINIRSVLNETISIEGFSGGGEIELNVYSRVNGNIETNSNSCLVRVHGRNTTHVINGSSYPIISSADSYSYFGGLNIDANNSESGKGITSQRGSNVYVEDCDIVNVQDALYALSDGSLQALDTKGNPTRHSALGSSGAIRLRGMIADGTTFGFVESVGEIPRTPSSFSPPDTTTVTETRTFNHTDIYTYSVKYGARSTHYGKAAAQNRWDTSMTQMKGRISFGSSVYSFISGRNSGTTPTVKIRLRRQNSSHGASSSVAPTPEWSGAPSFGGATRGNWTPWVTIPYTLFTSSGYTFSFYNGTTGNSYAIWDRAEIQITRTVTQ